MSDTVTAAEQAAELGRSDRTVRAWLRAQGWPSVPYARWPLDRQQADAVRAQFRALDVSGPTRR